MVYPSRLQKLIDFFSRFPGVGPKRATRFVFYLINLPEKELLQIGQLILELKSKLLRCVFCFFPFEKSEDVWRYGLKDTGELCPICRDRARNKSLLCIVEKETDIFVIESSKSYRGFYFILGGTAGNLGPKDLKGLRLGPLKERVSNPQKFGLGQATKFQEIILAFDLTLSGQATSLYLEKELKGQAQKISRLAQGLPTGGELEYADQDTLKSAFEGRK